MAEDSFIREVDEQFREDRAKELWDKYKWVVIGVAVLIVVATAGFKLMQYNQQSKAAQAGDAYMSAIALSDEGKYDEAITALEKIGVDGPGQYPALAKIRIASELAAKGNAIGAIQQFDAIASDQSFVDAFRDIATLRAGLLAVDLEDYNSVVSRLSGLAKAGGAFRHSAREALGIAAIKAGEDVKAVEWFQSIIDDANSDGVTGIRSRAETMLNLLAGKGAKASG